MIKLLANSSAWAAETMIKLLAKLLANSSVWAAETMIKLLANSFSLNGNKGHQGGNYKNKPNFRYIKFENFKDCFWNQEDLR